MGEEGRGRGKKGGRDNEKKILVIKVIEINLIIKIITILFFFLSAQIIC